VQSNRSLVLEQQYTQIMNPTASTGYSQGTFASGADPTETSPWFAAAARQWPLIAVAIACFAPIIYGLTGRLALDRDPYIYAQIGREMLEGKSLYDETWMDKPPLTYVLYAIPQVIFPRSIVAISVFAGIVIAVQGLMFAWAFRNCALAAICCLLFLTLYPQTVLNFAWASTEHFSNVFVAGTLIIALSIFRERKFSILQCVTVARWPSPRFTSVKTRSSVRSCPRQWCCWGLMSQLGSA